MSLTLALCFGGYEPRAVERASQEQDINDNSRDETKQQHKLKQEHLATDPELGIQRVREDVPEHVQAVHGHTRRYAVQDHDVKIHVLWIQLQSLGVEYRLQYK